MDQIIVPTFTLQIVSKGTMLGFIGIPIERLKSLKKNRKKRNERERERKVRIK